GNLNTIQTLLSNGFDPNGPVHGYTALWFGMNFAQPKAIEMLLAAHADPNALVFGANANPHNATPLQYAAQLGNARSAYLLIAAGAKVDAEGTSGHTALHFAVRGHDLELIRVLIEGGADVTIRDAEGTSPLDEAICHAGLDEDALLLAHGARLNEPHPRTGAT